MTKRIANEVSSEVLTTDGICGIIISNWGECGVFCNGFFEANCATVTRFLFLLTIHFLFSQKSLDKTAQLCYNSLVTINRRGHTDTVFGQTAVDSDISNQKIISGADSLHKDLICSAACDREEICTIVRFGRIDRGSFTYRHSKVFFLKNRLELCAG